MAQERLEIRIEANNSQSTQAFAQTNSQMGSMEQMAARIATSISQHFTQMASDIQRAIQGLSGVFSGLQAQAGKMGGLVDQYGRPMAASGVSSASSIPPVAFGVSGDHRNTPLYRALQQQPAEYKITRAPATAFSNADIENYTAKFLVANQKYVQGIKESGQETANTGNSMTGGMLKAMAFYAVLSEGVHLLKEATVGAAMYAARTEQLGVALHAVARAHGINDEAIDKQVEKVKKLGVTTQDARQNMTRLIAARLDPSQAEGFARGAQDLGRVTGEGTSATMSRMMQAAIGGEVEMTRAMGLSVNYEAAYRKVEQTLGRHRDELTETEKRQTRFNEVLRASQEYAGAYAASMGTVGGSLISLQRYADEAKNAIGDRFAGALGTVVVWLTKLAKGTTESGEQTGFWIKTVLVASAAFATYKIAMIACTAATEAFAAASAAAMLTNPAFWIAAVVAAIVGLTGAWLLAKDKIDLAKQATEDNSKALAAERKELEDSNGQLAERSRLLGLLSQKELRNEQTLAISMKKEVDTQLAELRKQYESTSDPIDRTAIGTQMANLQDRLGNIGDGVTIGTYQRRYSKAGLKEDDAPTPKAGITPEEQMAKQAHAWMMQGLVDEQEGIAKVNAEYDKELAALKELAREKKTSIPAGAMKDMASGWAARATALGFEYNKKEAEIAKEWEKLSVAEVRKLELEHEAERMKGLDDWSKKTSDTYQDMRRQGEQFQQTVIQKELDGLKISENTELTRLDQTNAHTLASRLGLEDKKLAVRLDYIGKEQDLDLKLLEFKAVVQKREFAITHAGQEDQIRAYSELVDAQTKFFKADLADGADDKSKLAKEQTLKAQYNLIYEGNKKVFDQVKHSADSIFDAMLSKSQSVWSAMANMFKVAMLTVLKEVVTSQIARSFTSLLTGQSVGLTAKGGGSLGGPWGGLGRFFGGLTGDPQFGNGGSSGQQSSSGFAHGPLIASAGAAPAWGGFSNPFSRTVSDSPMTPNGIMYPNGSPLSPASSGGSALPGLSSLKGGWQGLLGGVQDGAVNWGHSNMSIGTTGGKLAGAAQSPFAMLGGSLLTGDGLKRGGQFGMLEDGIGGALLGGAMLGSKFGPWGFAIGAAAGLAAGGIRMLIRTDTDRMHERIRSLTGVDIKEKSILKQAVDMAKSAFGGNFDMFVRSKQGQDLIQMYSQQTGGHFRSAFNAQSFNMVQSAGGLYETPTFLNGTSLNPLSNLPGQGFSSQLSSNSRGNGTTVVNFTMPADSVNDAFNGRTVSVIGSSSGQRASLSASRASIGRSDTAAALMSPMTVTS